MRKSKLFIFLIMALAGGVVYADDQSDADIKLKAEASRVRTLSYIDDKLKAEFIYDVDAVTAEKLPKGDIKNLNAERTNAIEETIAAIRKQEPKKVVAIQNDKDAATTACYGSYWYYPSYSYYSYYSPIYYGGGWYGGSYYGGGGFYGSGYGYSSVWPYYGSYSSGYYGYPTYYWGY